MVDLHLRRYRPASRSAAFRERTPGGAGAAATADIDSLTRSIDARTIGDARIADEHGPLLDGDEPSQRRSSTKREQRCTEPMPHGLDGPAVRLHTQARFSDRHS